MKKKGFIKNVIEAIKDQDRPMEERLYLALAAASWAAVFIALWGDIYVKEDIREILTLVSVLVFVPVSTYICLKINKIGLLIKLTVISLDFLILPSLFFFGGGLDGGGVLWVIFAYTYAGLVLTGKWRNVMLVLLFCISVAFYALDYIYPELVTAHSKHTFYIDSFFALTMIGVVCFSMNRIQGWILKEEAERAQEAAESMEELSRAQNRFFSSMSHEIRTPINSILGLNELILREPDVSDEIAKDARGIQGSGKMLLSLINDILDFSKMEAGSMDIVPVDYKVGDLLSEIVNMIWIRAKDKGLEFNVSIDPTVPSVLYGDEVRIKQIIINLLNNSVKYTAEGSVELHLESTKKDDDTVELSMSITDTGMGIKKEALPHLFDAFKRVDEEKNRHIEGTGLGLSIVKQLVELMDGTISVNSVYGEGSSFTVVLCQGISDEVPVGDLNIHNYSGSSHSAYESSFKAPDARILIVDDNEMNLEVESKLLSDTDMTIDRALSGKEALALSIKYRYDVILMDHLMPEMDGIECLEQLRNQVGGLNRTTPVIILTANAGGENRELYNRSGFDGYLVKPVSGEALENSLVNYISDDKLILNSNKVMRMREDIDTSAGYSGKVPVIITSTSMCDLPVDLIRKNKIPILPFLIKTEEGIFKDGVQMDANELVRYISSGRNATSAPPDENAYTEFFAQTLKRTHHVIHIALTTGASEDYYRASEAAKSFENVTVINSGCLSSATGILVLIGQKLAQMNMSVEEIVSNLEEVKQRLKCSFIIDTTEYMAQKGLISSSMDRIASNLTLHPMLHIKDDKMSVAGVWAGSRKRAYKKYISKVFPVDVIPDPEVVFITYIDVPMETLSWIKEEISKMAYFENVVFKQASAAISSNCGPGSFGILYFVKSNKSYNLSTFFANENLEPENVEDDIEDEIEETEDIIEEAAADAEDLMLSAPKVELAASEVKWYDDLQGIDGSIAIKNSGSEDAFKTVLKIFYESIEEKTASLNEMFENGQWKDYTIKVHALKSSAKLIGAMETAEKAQLLENAGKEDNIDYIRDNHPAFIEEYANYKPVLSGLFEEEKIEEEDTGKPVADDFMMMSVYEGLREAADNMDCDAIEDIINEMSEYSIPEGDKEKFETLCDMAGKFDYDGMLELLDQQEG